MFDRFYYTYSDSFESCIAKCREIARTEYFWLCLDGLDYSGFNFQFLPERHQLAYIQAWSSHNNDKLFTTFLVPTDSDNGIVHHSETLPVKNVNYYDVCCIDYGMNNIIKADYTIKFTDSIEKTLQLAVDKCDKTWLWITSEICDYTNFNFNWLPSWYEQDQIHCWPTQERKKGYTFLINTCYYKSKKMLYNFNHSPVLRVIWPNKCDIIFISYDEPEADINYELLKKRFPRIKRISGIDGMENAKKAAANLSDTPHFYAFFAKTKPHPDFNFDFVPDYWQIPKHYIFYSHNTVNGLEYGHMGIVLYDKNMLLNAPLFGEFGTDYTMSFPHEVKPILSCYGSFDTSPYHTWRTAFRETHKLSEFNNNNLDIETQYRLHVWRNIAHGDYAEWSLRGANDGIKFYEQYKDDAEYRRNTFRWQWLRNYFVELYGTIN
jgi:hypothetical protein